MCMLFKIFIFPVCNSRVSSHQKRVDLTVLTLMSKMLLFLTLLVNFQPCL